MKRKLGVLVRVLVSLGILAYLFNSIFQAEVNNTLQKLARSPDVPVEQLARELDLTPRQIQLVRSQCLLVSEDGEDLGPQVDLAKLQWRERLPLVWQRGPHALWQVFQHVSPWWFALATGCFGVVCLLGIIRWQMILRVQGLQLSFARATSIFFIGHFFNAFMLGATGGDVIKAWYVAHETHHKKAEAVATVIVDRIIGLLALFVIALIMMAIYWHRMVDDVRMRSFAIITFSIVLITAAGTALGFWRGFADKLPRLRQWLKRLPHYDTLKRIVDASRLYASHPRVLGWTMLQSFAVHCTVMLSIVCVARGLSVVTTNGVVDYFLYLPIINSVAAIPITISGFGVREGMYVAMFDKVGVPHAVALAMSLLGFITSLLWSLVGGIFFLTHRKEIPTSQVIAEED